MSPVPEFAYYKPLAQMDDVHRARDARFNLLSWYFSSMGVVVYSVFVLYVMTGLLP